MNAHIARLGCVALLAFFTVAMVGAAVADEDIMDSGAFVDTGPRPLEAGAGFIVDRTITQFGGEFFRHFSRAWREQGGTEGVNLTVVERPSARSGSIVFVEHNNRPEARAILYAGRSATIKPLAEQTAQYMAKRVADQTLTDLLLNDPDLGKPEF